MATQIPEAKLVELRALGVERANGRFVDPRMIHRCTEVLRRRGEVWAASVLGRDISRRSIAVPSMPFLRDGEEYTLVYADTEEDNVVLAEMEQ